MGSTKIKKFEEEIADQPAKAENQAENQEETAKVEAVEGNDDKSGDSSATMPRSDTKESAQNEKKVAAQADKKGKKPKKGVARIRSKKYQEAAEKIEKTQLYPLTEAIDLSKNTSYGKFNAALEVHINTNVKNVRGLVSLPHLSGKQLKVLAFGQGAAEAGADMVGDDERLAQIEKGKIDFDALVATPVWMVKLARSAKILGPRGLMPNPKNGTVTDNLEKAIAELKSGKVEYKTETNLTVMHLMIGKLSQPAEELAVNLKTLYWAIGKSKVKKLVLSPTMGPAIKVDLASL